MYKIFYTLSVVAFFLLFMQFVNISFLAFFMWIGQYMLIPNAVAGTLVSVFWMAMGVFAYTTNLFSAGVE